MALFSIKRFMGEESDEEDNEKSESILEKLHSAASKRKSKNRKENEKQKSHSDSPQKKKRKLEEDAELTNIGKKKKSKKTHRNVKDIIEEDSNEEIPPDMQNKTIEENQKESVSSKDTKELKDKIIQEVYDEDEVDNENEVKNFLLESPKSLSTEIDGFTVIGEVQQKKQEKVHRVLPDWLAQPSIITSDLRGKQIDLDEVKGFDDHIIQKLKENDISYFFPVQAQVIPALLDGVNEGHLKGRAGYRPSDICCSAPTGSGKTLAFVLPIVQALKSRVVCKVRALAVLPVKDLASQVFNVFSSYCQGTPLKVVLITGQKPFANEQHLLVKKGVRSYQSLADIIVATPGRLVDHINQTEGFDLSQLRFLVIDEADRMIEEIKQDWLSQVENAVFKKMDTRQSPGLNTAANSARMELPLQKLLFSATLSQNPEKLQQLNLFQPKLFTSVVNCRKNLNQENSADHMQTEDDQNEAGGGGFVGKFTTPTGLTEYFIEAESGSKPLMVLHILHQLKFKQILCFTNSLESTHRLYLLLKEYGGISVEEYSSRLITKKRARLIRKFSAGKINILICSDAMARGMDVENVKCVLSYESPPFLKTYIHRVGRTARAGKVGTAFTLLAKKEIFHFKKMMKEAGKKVSELEISESALEPLVDTYEKALSTLPAVIKAEKFPKKKQR